MGSNKEKRKISKVSKEVRKQYDAMSANPLGAQDLLPEKPQQEVAAKPKTIPLAKKKRNRVLNIVFFTLFFFLIVVLTTTVLQRFFVGSTIVVRGASMEPTFVEGTEVWVNKNRAVKRGDVVVLYRYDVSNKFLAEFAIGASTQRNGKYEKLIKRVIALPGDQLWVEEKDGDYVLVIKTPDGEILHEDYYTLNDKPLSFYNSRGHLDEENPIRVPYVAGPYAYKVGILRNTDEANPFVVREGHFFFMGDNRPVSSDSRDPTIGDVPLERIIGVVETFN